MATLCTDAVDRRTPFSWPAQVLAGLVATAALVTVLYFFIDQPVIRYFRGCDFSPYPILKQLTRPPEFFVVLSPFVFVAGMFRRWFGPWTFPEKALVAAAVSTMLAALAALVLKISFGRSADGFHPFHFGAEYWAFPSGHTACTVSVTAVAAAAFPRWRLFWWSLSALVATLLVVLTFHFVGDVVGGAFVGWAIAGTVARCFGLKGQTTMDTNRISVLDPVLD